MCKIPPTLTVNEPFFFFLLEVAESLFSLEVEVKCEVAFFIFLASKAFDALV